MTNEKIYRGDIWLVDLNPIRGHEQANRRPCIVISADEFNNGTLQLIVIVPMTTKIKPYSWVVKAEPDKTGLDKTSYILCHQMRVISRERMLGDALGSISADILEKIERRLKILLCLQ